MELKSEEMTEDDAVKLGNRLGRILFAAAVADPMFYTAVKAHVHQLNHADDDVSDCGFSEAVEELLRLLEPTTEGMDFRVSVSSQESENAARSRETAAELAREAAEEGDVHKLSLVEGILSSAKLSDTLSMAAFHPVASNLERLIASGRKAEFLKQVAGKAEDELHNAECENPDCSIHTKH
jgi:hypothetical protein